MRHARVLAGTLLTLALLVGCTSTSGGGGTTSAPSTAGGGSAGGQTVTLQGFAFKPAELTVKAGETVTFTNSDSTPHTVTNGTDGQAAADAAFNDPVAVGQSVQITFDTAGTFPITCTIHRTMHMTVTVS